MRRPGQVLLLSCYELGHAPLGVAWPLAFLRQAGFRPAVIDLALDTLDEGAVRRAEVVALSVPMHTALRVGLLALEQIRRINPQARLVAFGHYAALLSETLAERGVEVCLGGESEPLLVEALEALEAGQSAAPRAVATRRLAYPAPARDLLPGLDRYAHLDLGGGQGEGEPGHRVVGYVEASRGCKHSCAHCPIPPVYEGKFVAVPLDTVLGDVAAQVEQGATHVTFGDPDFLNGPGHARKLLEAFASRFPGVSFDVTAKVSHLLAHPELLPLLRDSGCAFVVSAVESFDDRVLEILAKGHTRAQALELFERARSVGLTVRPTFVAFTPWTTLEGYLELLERLAREDLLPAVDPIQLAIRLLVPPGSLLAEHPEFLPFRQTYDPAALAFPWDHPDRRLDELQGVVQRIVEEQAEDPQAAHAAIRRAAEAVAGRSLGPLEPGWRAVPRLSEPWFC